MKKLLSILLAIIMTFSISVSAFAAGGTVIENQKVTVTVNEDDVAAYKFTAAQDAVYVVKGKVLNEGFAVVDVYYDGVYINGSFLAKFDGNVTNGAFESFFADSDTCEVYFCAKKGAEFEIEVSNSGYFDEELGEVVAEDAKVEFTVSQYNAPTVKMGKNAVGIDYEVFLFIPANSGYYNFRSNAGSDIDPYVEVNDIYGSLDMNDDIGYADDYNFDLTTYLEKGEVYAICCSCYSMEDEAAASVSYDFTASFNKEIKAEEITLDAMSSDEELVLFAGEENYYNIMVVPTGAAPTTEVSVSVANEKIASAEMDEEDMSVIVSAHKAGKTTLTLTTADGVSTEYTIRVLPKIISIIADFFIGIIMVFDYLFTSLGDLIFGNF